MDKNLDTATFAVSLIFKAVIITTRYSGRIRKRSLKRLAAMDINQKDNNEKIEARSIPAWYPNHVWSVDTTTVLCWGLWPIHIFVVIDHFSRKVMPVAPLEGPNAGWINNAGEVDL